MSLHGCCRFKCLLEVSDGPCFFLFSLLFCFAMFLAFLCVFPFFSQDSRGSAERKILAFFGGSSLFLQKRKSRDWRVRVAHHIRTIVGRPQRLSRKVSENQKFLGRAISVICPGDCRVTEIQITSCPSTKEALTLSISVICTGVVPAQK